MSRIEKEFGKRSTKYIALSWALLLLVCCSSGPPSKVVPPIADELLRSIREGRANLKSLRAEGRAVLQHGWRKVRFHVSILAQYPDRFFLEAQGLGIPVSQVALDSKEIGLYFPTKGHYYKASAEDGLKSLLGIYMPVRDWVGFILGQIPYTPEKATSLKRQGKGWSLTGNHGDMILRLRIEDPSGWLRSIESKGGPIQTIVFGDPITTTDGAYPSSIKIENAGNKLELKFESVTSNPQLTPDLLNLDVPPGIESKPLGPQQVLVEE